MQVDEPSVVLPSTTTSTLSLSLHPLPILNISEHLTRLKLQQNKSNPFVLGALLGTQNGREVEIVNTFELAVVPQTDDTDEPRVDHEFLVTRRDQYKQVFPSLEFIGWYSVAPVPTSLHIALHNQFTTYSSTPLLLLLQPNQMNLQGQNQLPLKAYEPTQEIRERKSRAVFVEAPFNVETGEAERIAVDWTAKGGAGGTSLTSHLATQRAAIKMLHDRILVLVQYVASVIEGKGKPDHAVLRSLSALIASLPASENTQFREEFEMEYADVQITAYLSALTKSTNILNDLVDKHVLVSAASREGQGSGPGGPRTRAMGRRFGGGGGHDWEGGRFH
ncbi:COP9 signalosome subunit 6 [Exidia glandulosa HHB12029]|uniref:COP9 signalosome complex subunit 6 n=1 Tax=Exidia glandulosa HHB12029 TaxID=1314781 RepID=A0A165PFK6_EXIGL|nr:COP9 signalosome subunit 6 [Exidia glandulosa HHB12029]